MGPFIKNNDSTKKMMLNFLIALVPIIVFGIIKYGIILNRSIYPLIFVLIGVVTSFITETLYSLLIQKKKMKNINNYSIFTGLFLSLIVPLDTKISLLVIATVVSSILGKMIFGGFGKNKVNPSLIGYLLIYLLYYLKIINISGSILGNSSSLLILLSFLFLIFTKTIKWRVTVTYILTILAVNYVVGGINNLGFSYSFHELISSSLLFGAVFILTEQTSTPVTPIGQVLFGMFAGIITIIIRYLTPVPQLELVSILIASLFVNYLDKVGSIARFNFKESLIPFIIAWVLILGLSVGVALTSSNQITEIEDVTEAEIKDDVPVIE